MMRGIAMAAAVLPMTMIAGAAAAQQDGPPGYNETIIMAGGQADAIGIVCGKVTVAQTAAHKAKLRQMLGGKGIAPAKFDALYDRGFRETTAAARANPAQTRAGCARLAQGIPPTK